MISWIRSKKHNRSRTGKQDSINLRSFNTTEETSCSVEGYWKERGRYCKTPSWHKINIKNVLVTAKISPQWCHFSHVRMGVNKRTESKESGIYSRDRKWDIQSVEILISSTKVESNMKMSLKAKNNNYHTIQQFHYWL